MARSFLFSLRNLYLPFQASIVKLNNSISLQSARLLYSKATLGLDGFVQQQHHIKNHMNTISSSFKEKMSHYADEDSKNMIFTEDLKNTIYLAENDEDISLVVRMMKRFNQQNKELRFGNFVFGPVVMRLFHLFNKPDMALECFTSPELRGFFDQLITYQILLDLLYENKMFNEILDMFKVIQERQIEGLKFPRNVVVLTMAACYKLNSKESLDFALKLWEDLSEAGHFPMRRAATFCAGLALNQGRPEAALEILSSAKNQNYTTIRNIKAAALADVGRVEDAIPILKSVITQDEPSVIAHTFNRDVLERVKAKIAELDSEDLKLEFSRLEQLFEKQGHVSDMSLDEQLCTEIQKPPVMNNRQTNRYSRYDAGGTRGNKNKYDRVQQRPGLRDLV